MATPFSLSVIIVEKTGVLKTLQIKDFKEEELYKKCGFKKADDFIKQPEFKKVKIDGIIYSTCIYGKTGGKATGENKYDFPPPIDNILFFGCCVIVAKTGDKDNLNYINLTVDLWNHIYEKLFGGFEDLTATAKEDDEEIDELALVSKENKTKHGYLKDGFVVDSTSETDESAGLDHSEDEVEVEYDDEDEDDDEDEEDNEDDKSENESDDESDLVTL